MTDAVLKRLEAVAAKLEAYAGSVASGAPAASAGSSGSGAKVAAYDEWYAANAQPFIEAANAVDGTQGVAKSAEEGLKFVRTVLLAAEQSKKPSQSDFAAFLAPLAKVMEKGGNPDNRSPSFNQQKAWAEGQAGALSWVQIEPASAGMTPKQFVNEMFEASDFYLNKVLVDAKKSGQEQVGKFATTFKTLLQSLATFVQQNYATGLEWNPKGGDLKSFNAGGASSSVPDAPPAAPGGVPPPPPGPPAAPGAPSASAPSKPSTSGMGAVFGELNSKGEGVTGGLRKVTADMKSKNIKAPALEPSKPLGGASSAAAKKPAAAEVKREPKTYLSKGTWFVEHHEGNHEIVLNEVQLKENVYILKCKDCTIRLPAKCKSIQVDNCTKTNVVFNSIVSVFEIFNSQRVKIECEESVPSVAVDKSAGVSVTLSRAAVATPPTLITSSITEMNLVVPGATDEDDPIEIPLPEQYETKLVNGKLVTEAVSHSGN